MTERYTCWDFHCRKPIGNRDFASLKTTHELGHVIEIYYCTECCIKNLKSTTFEKAVEDHIVLTWYGKTWSFEVPLYKEEAWNETSKGLESGDLFPEDISLKGEKVNE